jgi:hypothetical protein
MTKVALRRARVFVGAAPGAPLRLAAFGTGETMRVAGWSGRIWCGVIAAQCLVACGGSSGPDEPPQPTVAAPVSSPSAGDGAASLVQPNRSDIESPAAIVTVAKGARFDNNQPSNDLHLIGDAEAHGWNYRSSELRVEFDFTSNGYFAYNMVTGGHFAVVLRCDPSIVARTVRGHGIVIGNVALAPDGAAAFPTTQVETWFQGLQGPAPNQRFLYPGTEGLPDRTMRDGVTYRVILHSNVRANGVRHIRYRLYRVDRLSGTLELERDTGDFPDRNVWFDPTKTGVAIAHVFENRNAPDWSVDIDHVRVIWGPPSTETPFIPG